jgi:hypothetical protein
MADYQRMRFIQMFALDANEIGSLRHMAATPFNALNA